MNRYEWWQKEFEELKARAEKEDMGVPLLLSADSGDCLHTIAPNPGEPEAAHKIAMAAGMATVRVATALSVTPFGCHPACQFESIAAFAVNVFLEEADEEERIRYMKAVVRRLNEGATQPVGEPPSKTKH